MLLLDSVLTQVLLNTDMLHHAKNISTGVKVKGNNVQKSIWHHNHGSYFIITFIKYPKQTAVKIQESTVSPEANIPQKVETIKTRTYGNSTLKSSLSGFNKRMECQFHECFSEKDF
jgi:hypothetical protein